MCAGDWSSETPKSAQCVEGTPGELEGRCWCGTRLRDHIPPVEQCRSSQSERFLTGTAIHKIVFHAELVPQRREMLNLVAALALGSLRAQVPQARAATGELAYYRASDSVPPLKDLAVRRISAHDIAASPCMSTPTCTCRGSASPAGCYQGQGRG